MNNRLAAAVSPVCVADTFETDCADRRTSRRFVVNGRWLPDARLLRGAMCLFFLCLVWSHCASATPIVFTVRAVGSGSLGSTQFNNVSFTLTGTADTSQISNSMSGLYNLPNLVTTISIQGFATASFTDTTGEASNQNVQIAGESDFTLDSAILGVQSNAFQNYDLSTSIGPIVGSPFFNPNQPYPTTSGNFSLSNIQSVSFQAQIVPEPSSWSLLIPGTLIFIGRFFWKGLSRSQTTR